MWVVEKRDVTLVRHWEDSKGRKISIELTWLQDKTSREPLKTHFSKKVWILYVFSVFFFDSLRFRTGHTDDRPFLYLFLSVSFILFLYLWHSFLVYSLRFSLFVSLSLLLTEAILVMIWTFGFFLSYLSFSVYLSLIDLILRLFKFIALFCFLGVIVVTLYCRFSTPCVVS